MGSRGDDRLVVRNAADILTTVGKVKIAALASPKIAR